MGRTGGLVKRVTLKDGTPQRIFSFTGQTAYGI
jgi:hypothetical protein